MPITQKDLIFDAEHIWHPYTNLNNPTPVFPVESTNGVYLNLTNGQVLVDGMSSWWSAIHGYNHPAINHAIQSQIEKMSHVMFGGLTHQPAIELCQKLITITPEHLDCIFLSDSGSVAIEVALKMALQYCFSIGKKNKHQFLTIDGGYHGDTLGAMSVCDPVKGMHSMFRGVLPKHIFVESPCCVDDSDWQDELIDPFRNVIEKKHQQIAAVILEPLVQGAGGMRFYCAEYLRQIRALCDEYQVILILDEIATGFARTGSLFAFEQAEITPDILTVGKALTGGYLSLGATLCSREIADGISGFADGNLMHGPTFMGNPLACAAANASLGLLLAADWKSNIQRINNQLKAELFSCKTLPNVSDVRVKGAIGVVELRTVINLHKVQPRLVDLGVWIRPFGRLIYIMPPYIITSEELSLLTSAINQLIKEDHLF